MCVGKMCVCAGEEGFFMHEKRLLYSIDLLGGGAGKWGKNAPNIELYRDGSQLSLLQPTLLNNQRTVIRIVPPPTRSSRVA